MTVELLLKELFVVPNEWIVIDITYDTIIFEDEEGNRFSKTHQGLLEEYVYTTRGCFNTLFFGGSKSLAQSRFLYLSSVCSKIFSNFSFV